MKSDISAIAFILLFLIFFTVFANSCSAAGISDPFSYSTDDFDAEISGVVDSRRIEANLQYRAGADSSGERLIIRFSSPESLSGLVATIDSGKTSYKLGDTVYEGRGAEGALLPFLSVLGRGEISSSKINERGEHCVTVKTDTGELLYIFGEGNRLPCRIVGNVSGTAIDFDIKSAKTQQ